MKGINPQQKNDIWNLRNILKFFYKSLEVRFIFFFCISIVIAYLIVNYQINFYIISDNNLKSFQAYNVIIGIVIALMGVFGGYLYFKHKDNVDRQSTIRSDKKNKVEYLISVLEQYDKIICQYLFLKMKNEKKDKNDLQRLHFEILKLNFRYTTLLENFEDIFKFSSEEINKIISIQSYVENNILFNVDLILPGSQELLSGYAEIFNSGLSQCIKKLK